MNLLNPSQDLATACGLLLNQHLNAMLSHVQGARDGVDSEELHRMRVSLRMLRAALVVFEDTISGVERAALDAEFSWIDDALGDVRDLDVFLDRMAVTGAELDPATVAVLEPVNDIIQRRRAEKRRAMLESLDKPRYASFIQSLRPRIEKHDLALFSGPSASQPLVDASRKLLKQFVRKAVHAVETLDEHSRPEDLHAARRTVRRLRYGLDFLGGLYGRPASRLRNRAQRIQEALGDHQDAIVAQSVLRSVVEELRAEGTAVPEVYVAIGEAIQREVRHAELAREQFFEERGALRARGEEFKRAIVRSAT